MKMIIPLAFISVFFSCKKESPKVTLRHAEEVKPIPNREVFVGNVHTIYYIVENGGFLTLTEEDQLDTVIVESFNHSALTISDPSLNNYTDTLQYILTDSSQYISYYQKDRRFVTYSTRGCIAHCERVGLDSLYITVGYHHCDSWVGNWTNSRVFSGRRI